MRLKTLVVFDFDATVVEDNSDTYYLKDLNGSNYEQKFKTLFEENTEWRQVVQQMLDYLSCNKVSSSSIKHKIEDMSLTAEMMSVMEYLRTNKDQFHVIIASDANSLFIKWVLEAKNIADIFDFVITNSAVVDEDDTIKVTPFHDVECVNGCPRNLCKRIALKEYLDKHRFNKVIYIGDGTNDICPCLSLGLHDVAMPRLNFSFHKHILNGKAKLNCQIYPWRSGKDILPHLNSKV